MAEIKIDVEKDYPGLNEKITEYFSKQVHAGYKESFKSIDRYVEDKYVQPGVIFVVPKGLGKGDLSAVDMKFDSGLIEIGRREGLWLSLPFWGLPLLTSGSV